MSPAAPRGGRIRIGVSGWRYPPWRGVFYPEGLAQRRELEYVADTFASVELNGSFYSLQHPDSWRRWREETPEDFVFAVKGPRYITHMLQLRNIDTPLANFFASGVLQLGSKLGPILWQFPPHFRFRPELLEAFFELLPRDTAQARQLARRRDQRMRGRTAIATDFDGPLRHAIEIRHESFRDPAFVRLLRRHRIALVVADTAGRWPLLEDVTADFVYLRLHGDKELYVSGYDAKALRRWAGRIRAWSEGSEAADAVHAAPGTKRPRRARRDVYCYFDNDVKVYAPFDAAALEAELGLRDRTEVPRRSVEVEASLPEARTRWAFGRAAESRRT